MSLVRGLYSCFLSSELQRSKSFSSLRSESKSFTRPSSSKLPGLFATVGVTCGWREKTFSKRKPERISLRPKGGAEKAWRGKEREMGDKASGRKPWKRAVSDRKPWRGEKASTRRQVKRGRKWQDDCGLGLGALLCPKALGGMQMQRYRQGTYGCCDIALSFEKWTKEESRGPNGLNWPPDSPGEEEGWNEVLLMSRLGLCESFIFSSRHPVKLLVV